MSTGTLYRLYPQPEAETHYTAVLLKDGTYLEVKNPNKSPREDKDVFPSLDAWREARCADATLRESDSTRTTMRVDSTHGFNLPKTNKGAGKWFRWCYKTIEEAAPELFASQEVLTAFNNLVEVCAKYPNLKLGYGGGYHKHTINLRWFDNNYPYSWNGFNVVFKDCDYDSRHNAARAEILPKYKVLYDLIYPKIDPYLVKKSKIYGIEREIKHYEKSLANAQIRFNKIMRNHLNAISRIKSDIKKYVADYKTLTGLDYSVNISE